MSDLQTTTSRRQRGMSIVAAIFIMIMLAGVAALMVKVSSTGQVTSAQDFEGSRAYQAARAGAEWGLFQLDANASNAALPSCFATVSLTQVSGYAVTVSCSPYPGAATSYQEGTKQIRMFRIVAVAVSNATFPTRVEREIAVTVEQCRDPAIVAAPFGC